jgi:type IV secretory pathway VirB6-like protein
MIFVFAILDEVFGAPRWLTQLLVYLTEAALIALAITCINFAVRARDGEAQRWPDAIAVAGGISVTMSLIMPFELGTVFFGWAGESVMATILLIPFYPIGAISLTLAFRKFMKLDAQNPDQLPVAKR